MSLVYQLVTLATLARVGDPAPLPLAFRGGLTDAKLADLDWVGEDLGGAYAGKGLWPVVEIRPTPGVGQRNAAAPTYDVDDPGKRVTATYALEALPIADLRLVKKGAALAQLAARVVAGRAYNGQTYQIDEASQGRIAAVAASAVASLVQGGPAWEAVAWRTAGNGFVTYSTALDFLAFAAAMKTRVQALRARYWAIVDAVDAAQSVAAVNAIDPTADWPN